MYLEEAKELAQELLVKMTPYCEKVCIAGSIRREKETVKDIELLAIPKREWNADLFGGRTDLRRNLLYEAKDWQLDLRWIKPGTHEIIDWHIKPDAKYYRGLICNRIKLDLFLCDEINWGIQYLIRTGSADFSQKAVTALRYQCGYPVYDGYVHDGAGTVIATPDEQAVFDLLGWQYIEPNKRD